jgi:hypothetical protein
MDGGSTADIAYIPFLLFLMLFGLMLALVGYWRVGASFSTQLSAQTESVNTNQGQNMLAYLWGAWTGLNLPKNSSVSASGGDVHSLIDSSSSFNEGPFGKWQFDVGSGADMNIRVEVFRPGPTCQQAPCP